MTSTGTPEASGRDRGALLRRVSQAGYKLTGPRRAILQALAGREGHFRAEEVLAIAQRLAPRTGRATVYRTLDLLVELGVVEQVHLGEGSHSYVVGDLSHHHHLICSSCGRVTDFWGCQIPDMLHVFARQHGFQIEGHQLEVYGRCLACGA